MSAAKVKEATTKVTEMAAEKVKEPTTKVLETTSNVASGTATFDNGNGAPGFAVNNSKLVAKLRRVLPDQDPIERMKLIRELPVRDDDVFICAFPKCGTHWIWEVVFMLLRKNPDYATKAKDHAMLEFCHLQDLNSEPSPRVLNSHMFMVDMPWEIVSKKTKIIHLIRNPKDTSVSYFHHTKQIYQSSLAFEEFLGKYMANELMIGHQFNFLRQFEEFLQKNPDHPVKVVYFEDMKLEPVKIIKELAEFLNVEARDSLCQQIATSCSFDNMKKEDQSRKRLEHLNKLTIERYRKGIVGDWKNTFTVAMNEVFDDFVARETKKGINYKFVYE